MSGRAPVGAPVARHQHPFGPERLGRLARAERWHFWFVGRRALVERLLRRHLPPHGQLVLDAGCGTGWTSGVLAAMGYRVVGLDLLPRTLPSPSVAARRVPFVQGDAGRLPLRAGQFDAVVLLDVLEHADDRSALDEAVRAVRPGGVVLVSVPAGRFLWSHRDRDAGHLRRYTRRGLAETLRRAGLRPVDLRGYQFLLFPVVAASRLVGRLGTDTQRLEESPPRWLNSLFTRIALAEVRLGDRARWPWGSSLVAVCRRP